MKSIISVSAFFLGVLLPAAEATPTSLPDGLALQLGGEKVELRVASPHAFRLHVAASTEAARPTSIYLSDATQPATSFTEVDEGAAVGIKTAFGELLVDPDKQMWTLRDADGKTLTDWATLGKTFPPTPDTPSVPPQPATPTQPAIRGKPMQPGLPETIHLLAGNSILPHPLFYGSGSTHSSGSLLQPGVNPATGNGRAGLPQYWSSGGYGALMVGPTDNAPASWKTESQGGTSWIVPGTSYDLYLIPAKNLYEWLQDDTELTGRAPVPPRWAFGYMQSRWGWEGKDYIDQTFTHFRQDKLPVDVFILDFEWYTVTPDYSVKQDGDPNFADFGWNPQLLPDPAKQIADFKEQGLHIVGIRKPRLGNADNLAMARSKGWILPANPRDPNGAGIRSRNLDFSKPEVRAYWGENNKKFLEAGMAGFWNDEGETTYTEYSYWNMAELDLLKQVDPSARFWSLNRSFIPGMQRFGAAAWTGDIHAEWGTLARTPGDLLSYGLSGLPYSGCDIGGYSGKLGTPEMLVRWMEAGVFFPVMRSHSQKTLTPHFPWLAGPEAEAAIRKALDLRYQLIPFYYSLAHESYQTGAPLMRPLVMEFPHDEKVSGMADEWLMGKGLLAAPILNEGGARSVYLPADTWFTFGTNQTAQGPQTLSVTSKLDEIPMYARAGTLLPLGPVLQYTGEATSAPLRLQIYPGHDGIFKLVEDDGTTLAYQKGAARLTTFSWNDATKTLSWKIEGSYDGDHRFHAVNAMLFSPQAAVTKQASLNQGGSINFP
jgi:alpha-glucosidase